MRSVSGRIRSPRPAASTIAVRGVVGIEISSLRSRRLAGVRRRHVLAVPVPQRRQRRMRQRALQIAPYPRDVSDVLRLAVAAVEPREDAEDFRSALRRKRGVEPDELGRLEIGVDLAARCARNGRAAPPPSAPAHRRGRPAAARRRRRRPGPSARPGSRAGRRGRCPARSGSQIRLGEWKSRSTQVGSALESPPAAPRVHSATIVGARLVASP